MLRMPSMVCVCAALSAMVLVCAAGCSSRQAAVPSSEPQALSAAGEPYTGITYITSAMGTAVTIPQSIFNRTTQFIGISENVTTAGYRRYDRELGESGYTELDAYKAKAAGWSVYGSYFASGAGGLDYWHLDADYTVALADQLLACAKVGVGEVRNTGMSQVDVGADLKYYLNDALSISAAFSRNRDWGLNFNVVGVEAQYLIENINLLISASYERQTIVGGVGFANYTGFDLKWLATDRLVVGTGMEIARGWWIPMNDIRAELKYKVSDKVWATAGYDRRLIPGSGTAFQNGTVGLEVQM